MSIGTIANNVSDAIADINVSHYDLQFVKPLDDTLLHKIFSTYESIVTIEDNTVKGGFGSAILEFATQHDYTNTVTLLGVPDAFVQHGSLIELQKSIGLDTESIKQIISSQLKK